jgi:putative spermidine/putrescine transport system substrate-binding protein
MPTTESHARAGLMAGLGLMLAAALPTAAASCYPATAEQPLETELVLNTSGGTYWDAFRTAFLDSFERDCGIRVKTLVSARHSFAQFKGYVQRGRVPYDLTYTAVPWEVAEAKQSGLIEPLPEGFWAPIAEQLIEGSYDRYGTWLSAYSEVLIYNREAFPEGLHNWADFFDLQRFPGPRTLKDSPYSLVIALLADGVAAEDIHPLDDDKLRRGFARLDQLRPAIRNFWAGGGDEPVQGVQRGDFVAGVAQSGRALAGLRQGYGIGVSWQQNLFDEAWIFRAKGARHPRAAAALLFYINDPARQAAFARLSGYGAAPKDSAAHLSAEEVRHLSTAPSNLAQAVRIDLAWWQANGERVQTLWREWVATGKVSL